MDSGVTIIAGIPIPSTSPVFLAIVGVHVLAGLACIIAGLVAMLNAKGRGRHSNFGTIYFWCLSVVSASAGSLAAVRWAEDYHLFFSECCRLRLRFGAVQSCGAGGAIGLLNTPQEWGLPISCF